MRTHTDSEDTPGYNLAFVRRFAHESLTRHAVLCWRPRSSASFQTAMEAMGRNN
jgi:hypothetical protein